MPAREKNHPQPEYFRELNPCSRRAFAEKVLGNRGEQAGAVAAKAIRIHAAAMSQAAEGGQGALDYLARARAAQLGDESDAAGVMIHTKIGGKTAHDT